MMMESLIFSKPIIPNKLHLRSSPRRSFKFAAAWDYTHFPSLTRARLKSSHTTSWTFLDASSQPAAHDPPVSNPNNISSQILQIISNPPKVVSQRAIMLVSAFCLLFNIHPLSALPAIASFETAAGGYHHQFVHSEILNSAWTGFVAGCLHTLSGPDHLAALAPLSIGRTRMESAAVGALWGCGHDAGQLLFGLLFLLLKDRLHIGLLETWGTRVVGFTLVVIGAMGIREASELAVPIPIPDGECCDNNNNVKTPAAAGKKKKLQVGFATFATGIVHGLQPDALMMVVPALALPSRFAGAAFLFMFLAGTVIAMGTYTAFLASCSQALKDRVPTITENLTWASSLVAIALGFAILVAPYFGFSLY